MTVDVEEVKRDEFFIVMLTTLLIKKIYDAFFYLGCSVCMYGDGCFSNQ